MSISLIIPAYNEESCLAATLNCLNDSGQELLRKTGRSVECIVVDNASDDRTAEIARSCRATVVSEATHNIARVRNRGASSSTGEVLVFVDADTVVPKEFLYRIHEATNDLKWIGGAADIEYCPASKLTKLYLRMWRLLAQSTHMAQGAAQFCKRDAFFAVAGYDESMYMGEDVDFWYRLRRYARTLGGRVDVLKDLRVRTSTRRFDQWPLWRTLVWTNPFVVALFKRKRSVWRAWYEHAPR